MPQKFIDNILRNLDDSNENNEKQTSKNTQYHYSRFSDFTFESSKNRLLNLKLSMCNTNDTTIKYTFLQNVFNFDNIEMVNKIYSKKLKKHKAILTLFFRFFLFFFIKKY